MKIKLSKKQWETIGKRYGWSKNSLLDAAFDCLNSAEKNLDLAGEIDLVLELQGFANKILDRKVK